MERKIGEIFEFGGEWYQCLKSVSCYECAFGDKNCGNIRNLKGNCLAHYRSDGKDVYFKKLKKDGEPYYSNYFGKFYQKYITYTPAVGNNFKIRIEPVEHVRRNEIFIEIKQTKEDMEEKKQKIDDLVGLYSSAKITYKEFDKELKALYDKEESEPTLKEFDIEAAKSGKPVCTRDGRKARIICFDSNGGRPIVALVTECDYEEEIPYKYHCDGSYNCQSIPSDNDLMMLLEKKEEWVNIVKEELSDDRVVLGRIFDIYEDAFRSGKANERYIATVKIEWTE